MGIDNQQNALKFATASCEKNIKIFEYNANTSSFEEKYTLQGHSDWVRDISWNPSFIDSYDTLASCSEVEFCI